MPRRVSLPGASELFRNTDPGHDPHGELRIADPPEREPIHDQIPDQVAELTIVTDEPRPDHDHGVGAEPTGRDEADESAVEQPASARPVGSRTRKAAARGTGRVRHEEKITVYVSSEELIMLEETRLRLRAEHGMAVDRGRIVRQAISSAMADFAARGATSELVRKLSAS